MRALCLLVLMAWAVGCATVSFNDVPPAATVELGPGRDLYLTKCANCHKFYSPADYAPAEWAGWMAKMADKARLTPEESRLISRYLDSFRQTPEGVANVGMAK